MIGYACRTGTRSTVVALRDAGWRFLLTAGAVLNPHGLRYALDNGAWSAHQRGLPFDDRAFEEAVREVGASADFIVAPDIVCGGLDSLAVSLRWLPWLLQHGRRVLVPLQDGMEPRHVAPILSPGRVGLFVGGSTAWKEWAIPTWGPWARARAIYCHVGRVNSARRIALCAQGMCSSFDGSSVTRFGKSLRRLDGARRQLALEVWP